MAANASVENCGSLKLVIFLAYAMSREVSIAKHLILISKFTSFKLHLLGVGCVEIVCPHVLLDTSELVFC